jgi:hypothetical protein
VRAVTVALLLIAGGCGARVGPGPRAGAEGGDRCPNEPEDRDGFEDGDGCPDDDNDRDGLLDVEDACPDHPGPCEQEDSP